MSISETDLHPYIKLLVEEYGELTTSDLIQYLRDRLQLDEEDTTILGGRNDDKFSQKVRNVVAHAKQNRIIFQYGYIIDKTIKPAVFYAAKRTTNNKYGAISKKEITDRKNKRDKFKPRKIDFEEINKKKNYIGKQGEIFALKWEKERLQKINKNIDVSDNVIHASELYGDGLGYDIQSRNGLDTRPRYIEVKTTEGNIDTPFYITRNEFDFIKCYNDDAVIYRVYDFDPKLNSGKISIITFDDLRKCNFTPVLYTVSINGN